MELKKVAIILNKNWEVEPALNALCNYELRPKNLPFPTYLNSPKDKGNKMKMPRAVWVMRRGDLTIEFAVYCIQDLMFPDTVINSSKQSSSNSKEKFERLSDEMKEYRPNLVITAGTSSYPSEVSFNASVTIGSNFFLFNGDPTNELSDFKHPSIGGLIRSNMNPSFWKIFNDAHVNDALSKFLPAAVNPPLSPKLLYGDRAVTVSSVNITDYSKYGVVDPEAVKALQTIDSTLDIWSVETTHGVVGVSVECPVIFVSGIANRLGFYDKEAMVIQRYAASFNIGVALGLLIVEVDNLFQQGFDFRK